MPASSAEPPSATSIDAAFEPRSARPAPVAERSSVPILRVVAGLVLVGLVLRPQILAIGPLLPAIRTDLDVSYAVGGLLATIPVLCMGLFAPLGPWLARRIGPRLAIAGCVAAISIFGLVRSEVPGVPAILLLTFAIGVATGTIGPVLAMIVSTRAPSRPVLATGAYAAGIMLGSSTAAGVAVPLAGPDGDWRTALLTLSIAALVPLVAWLVLVPPDRGAAERVSTPRTPLPWRSLTAWAIAVVFGLQSIVYYGVVSWLPNTFVEHGWDVAAAGSLIAVMNGVGLFATIGLPLLADRLGSRRRQLIGSASATLVGLLGVVLAPAAGWLWVAVLGFGLGAVFPLVLTLPVDVADRPADIGAAAAMMLLVGYALSSLSPVALGVVRDVTGNFAASMWLLVFLTVALVGSIWLLSPARLRGGVGHR